jgi:hypothetical protein
MVITAITFDHAKVNLLYRARKRRIAPDAAPFLV